MHAPDSILTLAEVAQTLRFDPRTVKRVTGKLGGKRIGNRWRFQWGRVLEYFHADTEKRSRKHVDGADRCERKADCLPDVPAWQERCPGMEGRERMGGIDPPPEKYAIEKLVFLT